MELSLVRGEYLNVLEDVLSRKVNHLAFNVFLQECYFLHI